MPRSTLKKISSTSVPEDMPKIVIPFPPNITPEGFLRSRPLSRSYFKSPNSFFIYRQQFVKQLKLMNYNNQMIKVSKWASISWSNEPKYVKQHYKNLEKRIQKLLKEQDQNDCKPCQLAYPRFIFEYSNVENKEDDNSSPTVNDNDYSDLNSLDWCLPTTSSNESSPIIADETFDDNLDELMNLYAPFTTTDSYPSNVSYEVNNNVEPVENNDLESYFALFDQMNVLNNFSENFVFDNVNPYSYNF